LNDLSETVGDEPLRFWSMYSFRALHQRSGFSLSTLELIDVDIQPAEMLEVLRLCGSSLQDLTLSNDHKVNACIDDTILQALTSTPEREEILCPHLKRIKFWACATSTDGLVSEMVRSRWEKKSHRINRLDNALIIFRNDELHAKDHECLKILNKQRSGLTVIKMQ